MPGCGCTGSGGSGSCVFSNTGNVTFGGSCAGGITGDVDVQQFLSEMDIGVMDQCAPFQIPVFQGGSWFLATLPRLHCAQIV